MNRFGRVTVTVWVPVAIVILIPLLFLNITTSVLLHTVRKDNTERLKTNISATNEALETIIKDANTTIQLITSNNAIKALALLSTDRDFPAYSQIVDAKPVQNQMNFLNSFGYITSLYFANSDIFISGNSICDNGSQFYSSLYSYQDLSLEDLRQYSTLRSSMPQYLPYGTYTIGGVEYKGIAYVTHVSKLHRTTAITVIPQQTLDNILEQTTQTNGVSALVDAKGKVLYAYGEQNESFQAALSQSGNLQEMIEHSDRQATTMSHFSYFTGLFLVSWNPQAELYRDFLRLNQGIWMLNISCIVSAMLISFLVVRSQILQLQGTLQLLSPHSIRGQHNLFGQIDQAVANLIDDKVTLNQHVQQQAQTITEYFWVAFLNGYWKDPEQIQKILQQNTDLLSSTGFCMVFIFYQPPVEEMSQLDNLHTLSQNFENLYQSMGRNIEFSGKICKPSVSQIAAICGFDTQELATYREQICQILLPYRSFLEKKEIIVFIGKPFLDIMEAPEHYTECWNYGINSHSEGGRFIWEEDIQPEKKRLLYFPLELENRLSAGIMQGNFPIVKECLRILVQKNFADDVLSPVMRDYLRSRCKIIFSRVYQDTMPFSLEEIFENINQIDMDTVFMSYLFHTSQQMCAYYQHIEESKAEPETDFKQKVIEYMESEFSNPDLSLAAIAEHFSFSESHFSKMLKNILGENFSTYLERKRMEAADRLVMETDLKVEEIALRVSYQNVGSFRRAYKRYIGVSPTERRAQRTAKVPVPCQSSELDKSQESHKPL